jgi:pilus assembly protein Flp/PilA
MNCSGSYFDCPQQGDYTVPKMRLYTNLRALLKRDDGQDIIEYALVVALIAFGATAGMRSVATHINSAYSSLGTTLGTYTTNGNNGGNDGNDGNGGHGGHGN